MLNLLIAAALAATPTPAPEPTYSLNYLTDAPLVCSVRMEEENRLHQAGLPPSEGKVIDLYAAKAKLLPDQKLLLTSFCNMFDLGALYLAYRIQQQQLQQEQHPTGLRKPFDDIASLPDINQKELSQ